jgi:hypothetical protein
MHKRAPSKRELCAETITFAPQDVKMLEGHHVIMHGDTSPPIGTNLEKRKIIFIEGRLSLQYYNTSLPL